MTEAALPPVQMVTPTPPPVQMVSPTPGDRLDQLHARYTEAKAAADHAQSVLKAITDGIKAALAEQAPGQRAVELRGPSGPALRLVYSESQRLDTTRLKREHPEVFTAYTKVSGSWGLRQIREGE